MTNRIDTLDTPSWFDQPGELLVDRMATELKKDPVITRIFGDRIEPYMRMDFGVRDLPAVRMFNPTGRKDSETGYFTGEIKADVIFPPSVRRGELQKYPDRVVGVLLSQFRRQRFFTAMRAVVPGLNELGRSFSFDKALGFVPKDAEELCPLTQITIGFRVLLDEWDRYLESDDRTPNDPFEKTLGDLERLVVISQPTLDDESDAPIAPDRFNVTT